MDAVTTPTAPESGAAPPARRRYAGAEWLAHEVPGREISPLGAAVADLLGDVFCGLYHIRDEVAETNWGRPNYIEVRLKSPICLSTFDNANLTRLVLFAHDRAIRVELSPMSNRSLCLRFHRRQRTGQGWERHPSMEEALAAHRRYWPGDGEGPRDAEL